MIRKIPDDLVIHLARRWREDYSQPGVIDALVERGVNPRVAARKVQELLGRGLLEQGTALNYVWPRGE